MVICGKRNQNSLFVVTMEVEEGFGGDVFDKRQTMSPCPDASSDIFLNHQVIFSLERLHLTCLESIHLGRRK